MSNINKEEAELLASLEAGEWVSNGGTESYQIAAKNHFKKDQRVSLRISEHDLKSVQKRAIIEGMPYQTLITSLIHKYVTGRLVEVGK
jgi:predicted DNA binding CopG/RHH family protein